VVNLVVSAVSLVGAAQRLLAFGRLAAFACPPLPIRLPQRSVHDISRGCSQQHDRQPAQDRGPAPSPPQAAFLARRGDILVSLVCRGRDGTICLPA